MIVLSKVRVTQPAPDRMVVEVGGGEMTFSGLVFLLPGLALLSIGLELIPIASEDFTVGGVPVLALFSLPFVLIGSLMAFGRRRITLNLSRRYAVIQRGLLVPMLKSERSINDFHKVTVERYTQKGGIYFGVCLLAKANTSSFAISDHSTHGKAYAQAVQLASFLRLPLLDTSMDQPLEVPPAALDQPLRARLQLEAAARKRVAPPSAPRSQVWETDDGLKISIPGRVARAVYIFMFPVFFLPIAGLSLLIVFLMVLPTEQPHPSFLRVLIGFDIVVIAVAASLLLIIHFFARKARTEVLVNWRGIAVEKYRGNLLRHRRVIPVEDILDIDSGLWGMLGETKGVQVETRNGVVTFGARLPDAEVAYLTDVIKHALI